MRIAKPRPRPAAALRKAAGGKEGALRRLRSFLDAEEPEAVRWLVWTWDRQRAVTYRELRAFIVPGAISDGLLARWQEDYADFVNARLAPQWERAFAAAAADAAAQYRFLYEPQIGAERDYIQRRGAQLVTALMEEQKNALRAMASHAVSYSNLTPDNLSRIMRPAIGLTAPQAKANLNYWQSAWESGVESGMASAAAERRADGMAAAYAGRQHRYRAMAIARTELAYAYNEGAHGALQGARGRGYIGDCAKRWLTADDERVCFSCGALDGESVNMDAMFSNGAALPPAHPNCRCAVAYEEVTGPLEPALAGPQAP